MAVFPRLNSDQFPHLDNARPFGRRVDMDYGRYDYVATIKMCSVPWDMDSTNVVNWQSTTQRDEWFANVPGRVIELSSGVLRTQLDMVRVDVPYDVCLTYNYVYMQVPTLTGDDLLEHETTEGVRTVCAFVERCEYRSPSATDLYLRIDFWTMYLPALSVHTLYLERGHAPMYGTTVAAYLSDPVANCADLLTADVNYGRADIVASSSMVSLSTSQLMYVMASTIPPSAIDSIPEASDVTSTPAGYYDLESRDGHQVGVSGYVWGTKSLAGMRSPSTAAGHDGEVASALHYYGVYSQHAMTGAIADIMEALPVFAASIKAVYILPSDLVQVGAYHAIDTHLVYEIASKPGYQPLASGYTLTKSAFGYPARYADIAKLYTSPYAVLEVSDDMGTTLDVAVEDTHGTVSVAQCVNVAWPFLAWTAALVNVRGRTTLPVASYKFRRLDGVEADESIYGYDVAELSIDLDVPTYVLYADGATMQQLAMWATGQQQRESAIAGYQSTMRSANTAYANALASNATAQTNANASADTAQTNANNSAANTRANALVTNNERDSCRTTTNSYKGDPNDSTTLIGSTIQALYDHSNADVEYTEYATDANLKSEAIASVNNMVMSAAMGNVLGAMSSGVSGVVSITTNSHLAQLSMDNQIDHQSIAHDRTSDQLTLAKDLETALDVHHDTATTAAANNNATTTETNAANSRTTARANAARTKTTGDANSGYTRGTTETNAKQTLELARTNYNAQVAQAGLAGPREYGSYAGDAMREALHVRGLHFRIKTQSAGAIARTGDTMLRYGYAYGGIWGVSSWCPTGHDYCYWQASDVLERASAYTNNEVLERLRDMLRQGITVWTSPEKVGGGWTM